MTCYETGPQTSCFVPIFRDAAVQMRFLWVSDTGSQVMWSLPGKQLVDLRGVLSSGHYVTLHLSSAWPALVRLAVIGDGRYTASLQWVSQARLFSVRVQEESRYQCNTEIYHCLPNALTRQQIQFQIMHCSVLHKFLILIFLQTICVGLYKIFNNTYLTLTLCGILMF